MKKILIAIVIVSFHALHVQAQGNVSELFNNALALKKERKCTEIVPLLLKVTASKPDFSKAFYELGWCYNELSQFDKAVPVLQKALNLDSTDYLIWSEAGYSYYSLQQFDTAITFLTKANLLKPKTETTLYYLGLCYVNKTNKAEAVKKYNELSLISSSYAGKLLEAIKAMK